MFADENKSVMLQALREKQKDHVTGFARKQKYHVKNKQNYRVTDVNESLSIVFDGLVFLEKNAANKQNSIHHLNDIIIAFCTIL